MRQIRGDVAVGQYRFPLDEIPFDGRFQFPAIAGIQQRRQMRIDGMEWAKVPIKELPGHFSEETLVVGEADLGERDFAVVKSVGQKLELRAFAGAVDSFEDNEFSARGHKSNGSLTYRRTA